jgi:uncharacterized protein (TIGR02246 family)
MKKVLLIPHLTLISIALFAQTSEDTQAVRNVIFAFKNDFNEGNFKNVSKYTTNDWEHINPLGGIDRGRDEVLKDVQNVHQTFLKGVSITIDTISIRFITSDVAIADVVHKIDNYTTPDGVKHENEKQRKTYVLVKQNGKWLLTQDHNTIIQNNIP